jgi:hypothetical protein
MESSTKDQYMSEGGPEEVRAFTSGNVEDITELLSGSFISKLRFYCPSLYFKLSSWESDFLEKSYPTTNLPDTRNGGNSEVSSDSGESNFDVDRNILALPLSLLSHIVLEANTLQPKGDFDASTSQVSIVTEMEHCLDSVTNILNLTLSGLVIPSPFPTYWGLEAYHGSLHSVPGVNVTGQRDDKGETLAWSWGLGLEVSPIKTRSAHKRLGLASTTGVQNLVPTLDMGVLRGMKSLTREKS